MEAPVQLRSYRPADRSACLALLDGNRPEFFGEKDRAEFAEFLDHPVGPYFVLELAAKRGLAGCGGYFVDGERGAAGLSWGIVARSLHRCGLGRVLLLERLAQICRATAAGVTVRLHTSQHTEGFFRRYGFAAKRRVSGGYAPGLDQVFMELQLDTELCARIEGERSAPAQAPASGSAPSASSRSAKRL
jgi:predicted N-acetyltransferase YhbS